MASLGVWTVSNPFPPGLKNPGFENGSYLEVVSPKDGLSISENGRSVKVQTEGPHLVSLGTGRFNSAITIHPLPEGRIFIGNTEAHPSKDVVIQGLGIERDHCFIDNNNGLVTIYPQLGDVSIDGVLITEPTCLSQGCMLCLGRSNFFRFNNPKEAHLMKQASPSPRKLPLSAGFIPVESVSKQLPRFEDNRSIITPYMDGIDLVEKVSKYEYMSHSQAPPITSQDTPKYFIKEGVRILHSAPPVVRVHKGFSSENSIKNPSPVSRIFSPLASKPGFSTPPPYPHRAAHNKVTMSPKATRLFSKTPDPVVMGRKSPATAWSGRCTPTSPLVPGCRSHHVSVENLKACEFELHEQHRKAVQERLKDQEQEKQERQRLEEILNLCAEYEEQVQKERANKAKLLKPDPASNSSSGEFSSVSTDSSAPASTNSSNNSNPISSKSESNVEGYSSDDSKCNGVPKYPTLPPQTHPNQLNIVNNMKPNSSSYVVTSGYHTVPNRIKTNGSLPRDRGNLQLSPTSDPQFSQVEGCVPSNNGATLTFVNHKALNSASSEDELCAILGNSSLTKQSPTSECGPSSPCMGTTFLTYPHSPRTRIKTVVGHRDRGPEVYENKMAVSEVTPKKKLTLTLPSSDIAMPAIPCEKKSNYYDGAKFVNDNFQPPNHIGMDLEEEINKLQKEKQACLQAITNIKHKVSELDCQKNEVLNELQLEHALMAGELKEKEQLQIFEGNKLAELQKQKMALEQKYELTHQELESAKTKIRELETLVQELQKQIHNMKLGSAKETEISDKLEQLKAQSELLEIERKAFEDLEFQQLESQAHEEEEKEELGQEIECFKETIAQRQIQLSELTKQKQSLATQMDNEKLRCESQLRIFTEQLRQEVSNLDMINNKLKALTSVKPGATPCSSPESSPRTSDSDIEVKRNGVWNVQQRLVLDDNARRRKSEERSENCNSFHSFESESSSLTSSDTGGENGRRSEDKTKAIDTRGLEANKVLQKERAIQSAFQDQTPLVNHHHENGNFEVKRRDKPRAQRPLTRYLPVRNAEFDLRQHIESAGHQIELCVHLHLTASSCHGYLHKLGGTWKTWKKRWFVFDRIQKALLYYSDKGETKLKGGVNFKDIEEVYVDHLHSVKSPSPQSTFCVKTYDRVYYLMAPTPETMRIWVDVIFTGAEGYLDFLGEAE